jgi:hypothetical protein
MPVSADENQANRLAVRLIFIIFAPANRKEQVS